MATDNPEDLTGKILTEVSKEIVGEVYKDVAKSGAKESGEIIGSMVGFFNHVVMHPIKKLNLQYQYKLEEYKNELEHRIGKIPADRLVEPPLEVVGPTLEALKYTLDVEELREMYLSLLASSMDKDSIDSVHPSFVAIIKEMSRVDAQIFYFFAQHKFIEAFNVSIGFDFPDEEQHYKNLMPRWFIPDLLDRKIDPHVISASIDNLIRLGLILSEENTGYSRFRPMKDEISKHPYVEDKVNDMIRTYEIIGATIIIGGFIKNITLNDLGLMFKQACLSEKPSE